MDEEDYPSYACSEPLDEYSPIKPKPGPHPDDEPDYWAEGHWVWDEYACYYELTPLGVAIAAEDERLLLEDMAAQHYAEEARKAESPGA